MTLKRTLLAVGALAVLAAAVQAAGKQAPKKEQGPTTLRNLQHAYYGEVNTKVKYEAYAAKAAADGYQGVASLFRAAAVAESVHSRQFGRAIAALGATPKARLKTPVVGTTEENLLDSLKGEKLEGEKMYPTFLRKAEADNNSLAMFSFHGAIAAEKSHAGYYAEALANLPAWREKRKFLVCTICGFTTSELNLKSCPASASPREKFTEVE